MSERSTEPRAIAPPMPHQSRRFSFRDVLHPVEAIRNIAAVLAYADSSVQGHKLFRGMISKGSPRKMTDREYRHRQVRRQMQKLSRRANRGQRGHTMMHHLA